MANLLAQATPRIEADKYVDRDAAWRAAFGRLRGDGASPARVVRAGGPAPPCAVTAQGPAPAGADMRVAVRAGPPLPRAVTPLGDKVPPRPQAVCAGPPRPQAVCAGPPLPKPRRLRMPPLTSRRRTRAHGRARRRRLGGSRHYGRAPPADGDGGGSSEPPGPRSHAPFSGGVR
jgi:hypothetical protein